MMRIVNRLFVALLLLMALAGMGLSLLVLFLPGFLGSGLELEAVQSMDRSPDFELLAADTSAHPEDSPYLINYTILTPPMGEFDQLYLEVYSDGRYLGDISCLDEYEYVEDYEGKTEFECTGIIPYQYLPDQRYLVYATMYSDSFEYASGPTMVDMDWSDYEVFFWDVSFLMILMVGLAYILVLFPITLGIAFVASKMKHHDAEYTIFSLLNPFQKHHTIMQRFNSFLVSPYFWILEIFGILVIMLYMLITARVWESAASLVAFTLSGLLAFMVPFLWVVAWWYADFREREPLRMVVTFFLWGMLAALMAIGINTTAGYAFELIGIGFLSTFLIAPFAEEFFKGTGAALLGEHKEFNSIEDGLVFGFVIGMGFSFIEDWMYLLSTPMGSNVLSWLFLFLLRSILFSANHGLYTAIIGGIIGFLIEKGFKAPALGLLVALPVAALFHAMHNSGETMGFLFGDVGLLSYCCILIPLFDYGGLIVLVCLFIWALLRKPSS